MAAYSPLVTSAAEAEQLALAHVMARIGPSLSAMTERLVVMPAWTVTLAHGWVVYVDIQNDSRDPRDERMGGPPICYVEAASGRIIDSFWSRTSFVLQERLYRFDQGLEPSLPWPQMLGVRCTDGDHLVINLLPHETFCGNPLMGQEPTLAYGAVGFDCVACFSRTNGLGEFCSHCGRRLQHPAPPWYCATCPQPAATSS